AEQRLARLKPAVHGRPCEPQLACDRLHVDPFPREEALHRQRQCGLARRRRASDRTASIDRTDGNRQGVPDMAFSVPPLPYAYDALEPHIDKATMEFHHDKHHQAYVDKANAALEGTEWADKPVEEVLQNLDSLGDKKGPVKNNGGGHYNHSLFWENMSPDGGGEPSGELASAIDSAFGSFSDFQAKLKETGVNQFGSGWSWLVHDGSGLAIVGSANQDSPI